MADQPTYPHLPASPCLTEAQLLAYHDGLLSTAEQHTVEVHLLDCAFCSDALEGWQLVQHREKALAGFPDVTIPLQAAAAPQQAPQAEAKVIPLFSRTGTWMRIAAGVAAIAVLAFALKFLLPQADQPLADNTAVKQKVQPVPSVDSGNQTRAEKTQELRKKEDPQPPVATLSPPTPMRISTYKSITEDAADYNASDDEQATQIGETTSMEALEDYASSKAVEEKEVAVSNIQQELKANESLKVTDSATQSGAYTYSTTLAGSTTGQSTSLSAPASSGASPAMVTSIPVSTDYVVREEVKMSSAKKDAAAKPMPTTADLEKAYIRGIDLQNKKKYANALSEFDKVLAVPTHPRYADAQWQKALALLALNRTVEAKVLLGQIVRENGVHKAEAEAKLKTL